MPYTIVGSLAIYMLISSLTPGPGNILALNTMTRYGWANGKKVLLGICVGYFAVQTICVIGVYGMSRHLNEALAWMKYFGAAYLVWLAIHIIRSKVDFTNEEKPPSFLSGFLLQLINVKIYFYGMSVLSGYIVPYYSSLIAMVISATSILLLGCFATVTWAVMGIKIKNTYIQHFKLINVIFGAFLIFCAWNLLLDV
ncbi:Cysteine/O-acetylserine efflux protein [bioreactor metagenome]|uniref:Cysteine/O-acetylserine efflux protein n=1 Tax=bioreactor metagenome TaxID=1076179 RepID=A0A645CRH6_9ZZZZ|nr:LysE family transporter [Lachnospiraceae bacterium]